MEPQIIVPDLTGCELKPYVSYRAGEIEEPPLTAKSLFDAVYAPTIAKLAKAGKEVRVRLTAREIHMARIQAQMTGSDLMAEENEDGVQSVDWPTHYPRMRIVKKKNPHPNNDLLRINS